MKKNIQHHIGWVLFGIIALAFIWLLTRKKHASSVTHKLYTVWNSRTQNPPSSTNAPPFQDTAGNLMCAQGYSLWMDSSTGNFACYKDPDITQQLGGGTNVFTPADNPNIPQGTELPGED